MGDGDGDRVFLRDRAFKFGGIAWTSLLIELTPGPNMTYLAILSLTEGRRAGYTAVAGVALGLLTVGIAAALGLTAIITNSATLYEALRWAGVGYLLWLAWEGWREGLDVSSPNLRKEFDGNRYFRQGLLTNLLNPKAAVFYISILPLFVDRNQSAAAQTLTLTMTYVAIATAVHLTIVRLASSARPLLEDPVTSRRVRRGLSLVLAAVVFWLAWSTRRGG